jgi:hypothetical protein
MNTDITTRISKASDRYAGCTLKPVDRVRVKIDIDIERPEGHDDMRYQSFKKQKMTLTMLYMLKSVIVNLSYISTEQRFR